MLEIKKEVYTACRASGCPVYDYLPRVDKYPYIVLTTSNNSSERLKNAMGGALYFTIDIFSNYQGEKEIYEIEEKITKAMNNLFTLGQVMTIDKEQFSIINDTNPIIKHGVLIYKINTMEV